MKRISWLNLLLSGLIVGMFSYVLFQTFNFLPRAFNFLLGLVMLFFLLGEIICGLAVKRLKAREATWITPLQAPYVALFAQALSYWGSGLSGYLLALGAKYLQLLHADATWAELVKIGIFLILSLLCVVVSLIVEKWCMIDPEDKDKNNPPDRQGKSTFKEYA